MKKNNLLLIIALLANTLACNVFNMLGIYSPNRVPADQPPTPMLSQTVNMQSTPFNESGTAPVYTITAQIPALQGSSDARVTTFNTRLNQIVQDQIDQFKKDVLSSASNPPLAAGSSFDLQYSVIGQRADIWSIKFEILFYADGAAHPAHYSVTLNYDLSAGKEITLDELFLSDSNYLQVISDASKAQLSTRDIGFEGFSQGADPLPENYQRWNISNEGLVITFDEYQVAAYAAGPQVVTIPFSALQSIVNPLGALALFAQ